MKKSAGAKARRIHNRYGPTKQLAEKVVDLEKIIPQRPKPDLFLITYVRAEARTLQRPEFFRTL